MFRKIVSDTQKNPSRRCRLQLEVLEDRCLLSGADLTVMSYNLYQGSELTQAIAISSLGQLPAAVSAVEAEVAATDIRGRAAAWANLVAETGPDLLALQEASLWRIQTPSSTLTGHQTPATTVLYDFIGSLVNDLAAKGLHYTVVGTVNGLNVQGPDATGNDLRLTDRVALLARADEPPGQLRWANVQSADYHTNIVLSIGGPGGLAVTVFNGWVSADFTKRGETFRVITTHLDALVPAIGDAQAHELINGPANTTMPVIVMGDLNSPADGSGSPAHQDFIAAGFQDSWTQANPGDPGFTVQRQVNLQAPVFQATQRIDYVMTHGGFGVDSMSLEGTDPADRTASGLWPSDHAAIVAKLDMPRHLDWISGNQHSVSLGLAVIGDTMSKAGTPAGASANGSWFLDPRQTGTSQPNPHDNQAGNKVMDVTSVWDWDELGYFIRSLLK
ncbi:MAG TPA: endonuclease/exonuclease/phosphatase family protein [Gemmataceae bacterium]|jgi:endonuclease/exonuclease/phosphatase family metal-dependent hydrolase|nr:endonuclease/exonuclease/phosphatase family protein [Gemmataceae bacterium]